MEEHGKDAGVSHDAGEREENTQESLETAVPSLLKTCNVEESIGETQPLPTSLNDHDFSPCGETNAGAAGADCGNASISLHPTPSTATDCHSVSLHPTASSGSTTTGGPTGCEENFESERLKAADIAGWAGDSPREETESPEANVILGVEEEQCAAAVDGADEFNFGLIGDPDPLKFRQANSMKSQATACSNTSYRSDAAVSCGTNNTMPSKSLRLSIEPTFIRCTPLTTVFWHCGRHLKAGVQEFGSAELFSLSRQVLYIDDFISHSWRDGRWSKFISCCLLYNGSAAFVASLFFCAITLTVQLTLPVPVFWGSYKKVVGGQEYDIAEGCLAFLGAPLIYVWFLHSWVSIKNKSLRRPVPGVFLDRLCIHQTDEALKCKGILSIGGILKHSQRMVVLWSPEYFFRLWCMFEVAVWCHLDRMDKLVFVPLSKAVLVVVCASGVWMSCVVLLMLHRSGVWLDSRVFYALMAGALVSCSPVAMHYLRGLMRDLVALRRQLGNVSVTAAECFCCSHNHVHPDTGQDMQCDRELVMNTVQELFPGVDAYDCAKKFDSKVRKDFAKRIIQSIGGPDAMPMRWCLLIVAPVIWRSADVISARDLPAAVMLRLLFTQLTYVLESLIVVRVCFFMCGYLSSHQGVFVLDAMVSCFGAWGCLALGCGLFLKTYRASMLEALWPLYINIFISSLLNLAIFWSEFPPDPKRKRHTRTSVLERKRRDSLDNCPGAGRSSRRVSNMDEAHTHTYAPTIDIKVPQGEEKPMRIRSKERGCGVCCSRPGEQETGKVVTSWEMAKAAEDNRAAVKTWSGEGSFLRRISVGSNASAPCDMAPAGKGDNFSHLWQPVWACAPSTNSCPGTAGSASASLASTDSVGSVVTSWTAAKDRQKRCVETKKGKSKDATRNRLAPP